ncbi:protein kinase [Marinomonas ushuaiensis DSM 15871]|uniref:Protein kinase n=1 Tax=Marinomonas ushuaiensis DSM 15871 TaxID=1122207 RepID=X7E4S5_9GAMM|nr:bifunctional protein-serine/threonine kinase/phosphatase [Marinomonas ushuaiensis]ETX10183.1 protein kinase [Marinomonas ushuaiensis DSM 15871]
MSKPLSVNTGYATNKGRKEINQDFIGSRIPKEPLLSAKGIVLAIADGISSSNVSQVASQAAITSFLEDYYCTSDAWSVKTSGQKVVKSINAWLHAQTQNSPYRFEKDKGYICTFSALILKSNTAYLFHSGDSRIYRLNGSTLEQLTQDHRRIVSENVSYLTRALGIDSTLEIDYKSVPISQGDVFLLTTDGIYDFLTESQITDCISQSKILNDAANQLIELALAAGSDDNLSVQIVRVEHIPNYQLDEVQQQVNGLPLPPPLSARMILDGYEIIRPIYVSSRSHVFLARDIESSQTVALKVPSIELGNDLAYLESFMLEDWIAKRITNPHVVKAIEPTRKQNYLYIVTEYIEGKSLAQWLIDNPKPTLEKTRNIISQIAKALQAFHRQEMIHQDIRPANIMIDDTNTIKIIDFGSTHIAGVSNTEEEVLKGTMRYSAPEYFLGQPGTAQSDIYALGVITYQMLSGNKFPYGVNIAQAKSVAAQRRINYTSLINDESELPLWVDDALQKAVQINPLKRYETLSEFIYDLHHPNKIFLNRTRPPLIQRNPVMFWQGVSFSLLLIIAWMILGK